jgi:GT2 family glycosyltransferase
MEKMGKQLPKLSVIIVTFNSEKFLKDCLESVYSQQTDFPFQVIIVDNSSYDNSVSFITENFPKVEIIKNSNNVGFALANNEGVRHSEAEFIMFLNPDTILKNNALQTLVDFMILHPQAGIVGPKIFNVDDSLQRTGVSFPSAWNLLTEILFLDKIFPYSKVFGGHRKLYLNPGQIHEVDYLQGSCLLATRPVLDEVGLFDDTFFMYFEETDLCYRVKKKDYKIIYVPDSAIVHIGGSGMSYYDKKRLILYHQSYVQFLKKHYSQNQQSIIILFLLVRAIVRGIILFMMGLLSAGKNKQLLNRSQGYFRSALFLIGVKK